MDDLGPMMGKVFLYFSNDDLGLVDFAGVKPSGTVVKLSIASPKWTTWTDSDHEAFGFSLCAAPTHNTQCLNLENCGLSLGCTQERERDETLGKS